ncbi:MAG: hypothetical protein U0992_00560 [Planctomycetaceae bacterium]
MPAPLHNANPRRRVYTARWDESAADLRSESFAINAEWNDARQQRLTTADLTYFSAPTPKVIEVAPQRQRHRHHRQRTLALPHVRRSRLPSASKVARLLGRPHPLAHLPDRIKEKQEVTEKQSKAQDVSPSHPTMQQLREISGKPVNAGPGKQETAIRLLSP